MRQAGVLAAAGLYALENNIGRLKEDHAKAHHLAQKLSAVGGFNIDVESVQTNIVIISLEKLGKTPDEVLAMLKAKGVLLTLGNYMGVRAVTHMDVSNEQVKRAAQIITETFC
jgi:threonine aldolase